MIGLLRVAIEGSVLVGQHVRGSLVIVVAGLVRDVLAAFG